MVINEGFFEPMLMAKLSDAFQNRKAYKGEDIEVLAKGYPLMVWRNFLEEDFAKELKEAVLKLPFKHKATDLFDFYQSYDLKGYLDDQMHPVGRVCKDIFSESFSGTISKIIGKPLGTEIDFAAQMYKKGQYLLCHDDRLESRRIAFVLYLVDPEWKPEDGGQFDKFGVDYRGRPTKEPVESFTPAWNTLVFFEVGMWSHHQVAEVLGDLPRLSVAGWLHDLPTKVPPVEESERFLKATPAIRNDLGDEYFVRTIDSDYVCFPISNTAEAWQCIKPENCDLDPRAFDYPTLPVAVNLMGSQSFNDVKTCEESEGRWTIIKVTKASLPMTVNSLQICLEQACLFRGNILTVKPNYLDADERVEFVYWTYQKK